MGGNQAVQALHNQSDSRATSNDDRQSTDQTQEDAAAPLSPAEAREAVRYNERRYRSWAIRRIQDVVGASKTGSMTVASAQMIAIWQADHGLTVDGKVGRYTLEPIVERLTHEGYRNRAIHLLIDGHDMPTRGLPNGRYDVSYNPSLSSFGRTGTDPSGDPFVEIGPSAFNRYSELVHTIRHELEHVEQIHGGMNVFGAARDVAEFQGEATEILSQGMQLEGLAGTMRDAERALLNWLQMSRAERRNNRDTFVAVREEIRRRLQPLSAQALRNRATPTGRSYRRLLRLYNNAPVP